MNEKCKILQFNSYTEKVTKLNDIYEIPEIKRKLLSKEFLLNVKNNRDDPMSVWIDILCKNNIMCIHPFEKRIFKKRFFICNYCNSIVINCTSNNDKEKIKWRR